MEKKIFFIGLLILLSLIMVFKKDIDMFSSLQGDGFKTQTRARKSMGVIMKTGGEPTSYGNPTPQPLPVPVIKPSPSIVSTIVTTHNR